MNRSTRLTVARLVDFIDLFAGDRVIAGLAFMDLTAVVWPLIGRESGRYRSGHRMSGHLFSR